jgi:hypothetical protein
MSVLDILSQQFDSKTIGNIASQIDATPDATLTAISGAVPALLGGLSRNAASPDGLGSLMNALSGDHDGSLLDDLGGFLGGALSGQRSADGGGILGHVLGGQRGQVESGLSRASGLSGQQIGRLLMILAPIVMAALSRARQQKNLDHGGLGDMLHRESQRADGATGGLGSILLGGDQPGGGLDDLVKMGGGLLGSLFDGGSGR